MTDTTARGAGPAARRLSAELGHRETEPAAGAVRKPADDRGTLGEASA